MNSKVTLAVLAVGLAVFASQPYSGLDRNGRTSAVFDWQRHVGVFDWQRHVGVFDWQRRRGVFDWQ